MLQSLKSHSRPAFSRRYFAVVPYCDYLAVIRAYFGPLASKRWATEENYLGAARHVPHE